MYMRRIYLYINLIIRVSGSCALVTYVTFIEYICCLLYGATITPQHIVATFAVLFLHFENYNLRKAERKFTNDMQNTLCIRDSAVWCDVMFCFVLLSISHMHICANAFSNRWISYELQFVRISRFNQPTSDTHTHIHAFVISATCYLISNFHQMQANKPNLYTIRILKVVQGDIFVSRICINQRVIWKYKHTNTLPYLHNSTVLESPKTVMHHCDFDWTKSFWMFGVLGDEGKARK